jgi:ADP-ribosyl-[dinitrogen reductase] hydrolase
MQLLLPWAVLTAVYACSLAWILPRGMRNAFNNPNLLTRRAGIATLALSSIGLLAVSVMSIKHGFPYATVGIVISAPTALMFALVLVLYCNGIYLDRSPKRSHGLSAIDMTVFTADDFSLAAKKDAEGLTGDLAKIKASDGRLILCSAPGRLRRGESAPTLEKDLENLTKALAPRKMTVVTLLQDREMVSMGFPDLLERYKNANIEPVHFPIRDKWTVDMMQSVHDLVHTEIIPRLARGEGVIVHCYGGNGRGGTITASTLVALGVPPLQTIVHVKYVCFFPPDCICAFRTQR